MLGLNHDGGVWDVGGGGRVLISYLGLIPSGAF